jgi:hypothetical protein
MSAPTIRTFSNFFMENAPLYPTMLVHELAATSLSFTDIADPQCIVERAIPDRQSQLFRVPERDGLTPRRKVAKD